MPEGEPHRKRRSDEPMVVQRLDEDAGGSGRTLNFRVGRASHA